MTAGDTSSFESIDGAAEGLEDALEHLFRRRGDTVERSPFFTGGADLVVVADGVRTAVQARQASRALSMEVVESVVASLPLYGCARAMVVTDGSFTAAARELALRHGVELWDGKRLRRELAESLG